MVNDLWADGEAERGVIQERFEERVDSVGFHPVVGPDDLDVFPSGCLQRLGPVRNWAAIGRAGQYS